MQNMSFVEYLYSSISDEVLDHCNLELMVLKVGTSGYGNLQTMNTDKWTTSKSAQLSTKIWVKLLHLLENALKLNFD